MGKRKPGPVSKASPEVYARCLELRAIYRYTYREIAEQIKIEFGLENEARPGQPKPDVAIMRFLQRGAKQLNEEGVYNRTVQRMIHAQAVDDSLAALARFRKNLDFDDLTELQNYVDIQLKLLSRQSALLDVDLARQRAEVKQVGKAPKLQMDSQTSFDLAAFERDIQEKRKLRRVQP
jgi:hypothetical protein